MWIVSSEKNEGIFNLESMSHINVIRFESSDGEELFSLACIKNSEKVCYIGTWDTREKAEAALQKIVRANHEGNREVYLDA